MIFYFSGTGNTKWAAEQIALSTHDSLYYIPTELKGSCDYTLKEGVEALILDEVEGIKEVRLA